jgi:hypothetical protein
MSADGFDLVFGSMRGIGDGSDLDAPSPNDRGRAALSCLLERQRENHFRESLDALITYRDLVAQRPLLQQLRTAVINDAAKVLMAGALGQHADNRSDQGLPFRDFATITGLNGLVDVELTDSPTPEEIEAANQRVATTVLKDPRLASALAEALDGVLARKRVITVSLLGARLCEAWREALLEVTTELMLADDTCLWTGLQFDANNRGRTYWGNYRSSLPAHLPRLNTLIDAEELRALVRPERPYVDFSAHKGEGFSLRTNFRNGSRIHDALWPMVFAGLAKQWGVRP